jgi:outer membrane protein TolC
MESILRRRLRLVSLIAAGLLLAGTAHGDPPEVGEIPPPVGSSLRPAYPEPDTPATPASGSILGSETRPIDLDSAFRLAGVRNPEVLLARERITEAAARRQLAAAQILPNINAGTNYDDHTGNLQRSTGAILSVDRQALYLGAGAGAVGAGTVPIPGIVWNMQVSDTIYNYLIGRQAVAAQAFAAEATRNNVLLQVAVAYEELLRAEAAYAVGIKTRDETAEVARLTAAYAKAGQGRQADADRAATELSHRQYEVAQAEGTVLTAAARLAQLLNLDPTVRLHPIDGAVVPATIVAEEIPLAELIATALVQRPELKDRQSVICQALLALNAAKALPFSPTVLVGFSAGTFGGGSDLTTPGLNDFDNRTDLDTVAYWTLRNLGVGNRALVNQAASRLRSENYQMIGVLDQVRDEVAEAYARARSRFLQIDTSERAVTTAGNAFTEDLNRIRGQQGLPIEVLDSLRLLGQGRSEYLNAIVDYNRAQFELYVALGQPPAATITRPAPAEPLPPPAPEAPRP